MCPTCKGETRDSQFGSWCDPCGGVSYKPGVLFFRHVATVDGPGGRFPVVYDLSTSDYAYMFKDPAPSRPGRDLDGFRRPTVRVAHGSLDAMVALSYKDVKGDESAPPLLSVAPTSTKEERYILGVA